MCDNRRGEIRLPRSRTGDRFWNAAQSLERVENCGAVAVQLRLAGRGWPAVRAHHQAVALNAISHNQPRR